MVDMLKQTKIEMFRLESLSIRLYLEFLNSNLMPTTGLKKLKL